MTKRRPDRPPFLLAVTLVAALAAALFAPVAASAQGCPTSAFFPGWKDFTPDQVLGFDFPDYFIDPIGTTKTESTEVQFEICVVATCFDSGYEVIDVLPAEWDVIDLDPLCGTASSTEDRNGKGKARKLAPDEIRWDLSGCDVGQDACMTVTAATDQNPGRRNNRATVYEPTTCGPLLLNDGPVLYDDSGAPRNLPGTAELAIATCADESGAGCVDLDYDLWTPDCGDCDDAGGGTPGEPELCNLVDDNCDEIVDEGGATGTVAVTAGAQYPASQGLWELWMPAANPLSPILGTPVVGQLVDTGGVGCALDPLDYSAGPAVPYAASVSGNIALIERGFCPFEEKLGVAEAAGAIGVVIYDSFFGNPTFALAGFTGESYGIPVFLVNDTDGAALVGQAPVEVTLSGGCPPPV